VLDPFHSIVFADRDVCWPWQGNLDRDGYGKLGKRLAHRVVYSVLVKVVPAGLVLDHLCRNRCCVNPLHLEPVTSLENTLRGIPYRTHCPNGHEYTPATIRFRAGKLTSRVCKLCDCARVKAYRHRTRLTTLRQQHEGK
jgi:hypothetical protein